MGQENSLVLQDEECVPCSLIQVVHGCGTRTQLQVQQDIIHE